MSVLLLIVYLFIPVMGFAHIAVPDAVTTEIRTVVADAGSPCDDCPCSNEEGSHCCDTGFCSCAFHSPPVQGIQLRYDPDVNIVRPTESFWMLPQVYLPIFVPPQNLTTDRLSEVTEHEYTLISFVVV
jgi:hypothetical protein